MFNVSTTVITSSTVMLKNASSQPLHYDESLVETTKVALFIIILATVFGNTLVLLTTWKDKRLHQPNKYFIACLAVADLLVGLFVVPVRLHMQLNMADVQPLSLCQFWMLVDGFCEAASIVTLTVISVDRYFKISYPFKYRTWMNTSKSRIIIANIWLISFVAGLFSVFTFDGSEGVISKAYSGCTNNNPVYFTVISVLFFFFPSITIVLMYTIIFYIVHKKRKMERKGKLGQSHAASQQNSRGHVLMQELKTIRMLSLVVFTFILCWGPNFSLLLISLYTPEYLSSLTQMQAAVFRNLFVVILPSINSICNPIIYACCDREYNKAFKQFLANNMFTVFLSRLQSTHLSQVTSSSKNKTELEAASRKT
ncbi:beta-2 adrenergic receptor-like [Xenia sp. Carnegie-2017]|uniref:beta-2 adrenergic receptor-like n=1 Tax=Xenia sp. Carnegie-2017 TaxID=2897299 RepID=UPI001F03C8E4|nr:beta-2 adrenergic receptor-like [Xenia sp. Carnegie-2017]XP_046845936.1 beta-2 adrenergic receptor-like [Xenia sp. Carnegie-2017]XP_046845937.1 beta-2 adrenergic receptor-like [Xenia sp. Carnegie-2017]